MSGPQTETAARAAAARAAAARAAVERFETDMTIGLGSGRAVAAVIEIAAQRWPAGPPLLCAAASAETDRLARAAGFAVVSLDDLDLRRRGPGDASSPPALLDLVVDGADEVDPRLDLVKGGGGALLREKLVARAGDRLLIVVEDDKLVAHLGERHALPVEIVRFGWRETRRELLRLVPTAVLRRGPDGRAFVTDEEHFIVDCDLARRRRARPLSRHGRRGPCGACRRQRRAAGARREAARTLATINDKRGRRAASARRPRPSRGLASSLASEQSWSGSSCTTCSARGGIRKALD